jgi:hypothetical protein
MDTGTLIKVVAMIDTRIAVHNNAMEVYHENKWKKDEDYYILLAKRDALEELMWHLQGAIDSAVSAMETSIEAGE